MKYKNVFAFTGMPGLICEEDGSFYYQGKFLHKKYRPGQIYIQICKKRYGMRTLRKLAYKTKIEIENFPF